MLEIIAIQENRLQTKSDIDTTLQPELTFYYSSANSCGNVQSVMFPKYLNILYLLPSNVSQ